MPVELRERVVASLVTQVVVLFQVSDDFIEEELILLRELGPNRSLRTSTICDKCALSSCLGRPVPTSVGPVTVAVSSAASDADPSWVLVSRDGALSPLVTEPPVEPVGVPGLHGQLSSPRPKSLS